MKIRKLLYVTIFISCLLSVIYYVIYTYNNTKNLPPAIIDLTRNSDMWSPFSLVLLKWIVVFMFISLTLFSIEYIPNFGDE